MRGKLKETVLDLSYPLYAAATRLTVPAYLARLLWRARAEPLYGHALGERLGVYDTPASSGWLWVHAVSLGETRAAAPLISALRERDPALRLLLTHGTATGREAGAALLRDGDRQAWFPWDTPGATRRFLQHHRPRAGVLMETELWPQLLRSARESGVPMILANARLSESSQQMGLWLHRLYRPAVAGLTGVLAQAEGDAQRLSECGATQVEVCGNLKFDMVPPGDLIERGQRWRAALRRPVVLAAVTREVEEGWLLEQWLRTPAPRPLLVIVPRHPQRFDEAQQVIEETGMRVVRRSRWGQGLPDAQAVAADAWLGDSMGEMPAYYALADVALLGASFAPLGGQNLIEAAACGCPVLMGPHTFNFERAAELALAAGAAQRVPDMATAVAQALDLLRQPEPLAAMAGAARVFAQSHRGAAQRMADRILALTAPAQAAVDARTPQRRSGA